MKKSTRPILTTLLSLLFILNLGCDQGSSGGGGYQEMVLYGSPQVDWVSLVARKFEEETGIKVKSIRMGSGETFARIKAEQKRPQADVWFGGTTDPHTQAYEEGLTEPYRPSNFNELAEDLRDPIGKSRVSGLYAGALGWAINTELLQSKNLPMPKVWGDLTNPAYKGLIAMANPSTSGTAYTMMATIVQLMGEEKAFEYFKQLHANIAQYTKSGSAPGPLAGRGEIAIAIIFMHDGVKYVVEGYPLTVVAPADGTGYEIGGISLIKNGPNPEAGKKFIDWALSAEVQELAATVKAYQLPTNKNAKVPEVAVKLSDVKLIDYDFDWAGKNRKRLVNRWIKEIKNSDSGD